MRFSVCSVIGAFAILTGAPAASAQVLIGTVVDHSSGQAIRTAEVVVHQGDSLRTVLTDEHGRFTMFIAPGLFRMRAAAFGYAPVQNDSLTIERFQRIVMNVALSVDPVEITPINVVSRRPQLRLGREGFDWRKERANRTGMGRILDAGDIARYRAMLISDLVRRQPFTNRSFAVTPYYSPMVRMIGRGSDANAVTTNRFGAPTSFFSQPYGSTVGRFSPCAADGFAYYINGALTRTSMEEIDNVFSPSELVGIEIYQRAYEAPGEFGGSLYNCGRIVIWTR